MNTEGIKNNTINKTGVTQEQGPRAGDNMLLDALSATNKPDVTNKLDTKIENENFDDSTLDGMTIDEMFSWLQENELNPEGDIDISEGDNVSNVSGGDKDISGDGNVSEGIPNIEKTESNIRLMRLGQPARTQSLMPSWTPAKLDQFTKQTMSFANYLVKIAQAVHMGYSLNVGQAAAYTNNIKSMNLNLAIIAYQNGCKDSSGNYTLLKQGAGGPLISTARSLNNVMLWFQNIMNGTAQPQEVTPQGLWTWHLS